MLELLTRTTLTKHCEACDQEYNVSVAAIQAGVVDGFAGVDPEIIMLTPCPCGAICYYRRTKEDFSSLSGKPLNFRKIINRLHARLKIAEQKCAGFPVDDVDAPVMADDLDELTP